MCGPEGGIPGERAGRGPGFEGVSSIPMQVLRPGGFATRGRFPAAVLLLPLLLASPAPAEGPATPPPAPAKPAPSLDDRLAAADRLVEEGKWKPALAALRAVFVDFKDSPEVVRRLPAIEEALKLCVWRLQEKPPTPEQIFGPGTKSFAAATRVLVLEFPDGPAAPAWEGHPPENGFLRIPFEDVTVDYEGSLLDRLAVQLSFDFDTDKGYDLRAGHTNGKSKEQAGIARLESAGGARKRAIILGSCDNPAGEGTHKVRFALKGGALSIAVDGRLLVSAKDRTYPRGFLGLSGGKGGSVTIRGVVEKAGVEALQAASAERRFREWSEKSWRRETEIPEWARGEGK